MADLNVVRKRSNTWLWIVGLIVLAIIIWAIVAYSGHRGGVPTSDLLRPMRLAAGSIAGAWQG